MIRSSFLSELCRISDMTHRHSHTCVFMYRVVEGDAVLGERHHEVEVIINLPASCTITWRRTRDVVHGSHLPLFAGLPICMAGMEISILLATAS